ncbi:MAG: tRNA (adenosine(37)-N6)-threonylcarbamoyltransferase complex dimerization subunit type 1 TsaB [Candidatus Levyibacteriota bacterium]|jgi:tRNA threonylcarbamoyladenosine biosynthesis protein TsaB
MGKVLKIDTSDNQKITIELEFNGKKEKLVEDSTFLRSEATLPAIDKLLKQNNLAIKEVDQIKVSKGPGSFTGLRVGVAIANALAFLLKIPVNHKKVGELEEPVYNK